jgi:enterochelin esterase-like enzyme
MPEPPRTPVIGDRGVTFAWHGAARDVRVVGSWCDWQLADALPLHRTGGAWTGHLELPRDAYIEYGLIVDGEPAADPGNPHRAHNGIDGWNNQLWMPGATRRALELQRRRVPRGEVRRGRIELGWTAASPKRRRFDLYLPSGDHHGRDLPLLLVLDGADYLDRGRLHRTLDGLIHDRAMAPVAAAFIDNAGPSRGVEYAANDFTLWGLADEVVPAAVERLGLAPQASADGAPGRAAILGSSMGGLMALHAAVRRPDVFGRAACQSVASFDAFRTTTIDVIRAAPPGPARLWLDAGDHEWLAEPDDRIAALLGERGYAVTYRRHHGGHNQTSWNESLVDALPLLFPPTT